MLYVVRHGESVFNRRKLLCGRSNVALTQRGLMDAQRQGEQLKDIRFAAAYCSPLLRARQTLEQILSAFAAAARPPILVDERIIERDFGYLEAEAANAVGAAERWHRDFDASGMRMEPLPDMLARVESFVRDVRQRHKGEDVLAVTHNGVIRMMRCAFHGFPESPDLSSLGAKNAQSVAFEL